MIFLCFLNARKEIHMKIFARYAVLVSLIATSGVVALQGTASANQSWGSYFKICKPILINQFSPSLSKLFSDTNKLNLSGMKRDMKSVLNFAGREASCANSPDKTLNRDVNALSTMVAATMVVGQEFLSGSAKVTSYEAGLRAFTPLWNKMAHQLAHDQANHG
jgi:hypothetical protein